MPHKHILDSHTLVWFLEDNPKLGVQARAVLEDPDADLILLFIVLFEIVLLIERRRVKLKSIAGFLYAVQSDSRLTLHFTDWSLVICFLSANTIPDIHDRLIVATALHLQSQGHTVTLLTRDTLITDSGLVPVLW